MTPPDAPRQPPRFVPTLTEVVKPDLVTPSPVQAPPPNMDQLAEPLVQRVLAQLAPALDEQVADMVAKVVHAQMEGLGQRVQQAVELVVREAVAKALAQALNASDGDAGPR